MNCYRSQWLSLKASLAMLTCLVFLLPANPARAADPWEGFNRRVFQFNDYFDTILVRPIATAYTNLTPPIVQQGIGNFFSNLQDINVAVNNLLQFKLLDAASDSGRVLINTTIGLVGFIDVASPLGLDKHEEDFGQTFGAWGIPSGPYLVIPTVGASSVRDMFGFVLDLAFDPLSYTESDLSRTTLYLVDEVDNRSRLMGFEELVFGDEYIFLREAYIQRREYLIQDGEIDDEFGDFGDF